jgi:CRISPR-associated protein (TIGR02710 family)
MKILIMTVGGSDEPMVKSINELNPEHIFFICSSGKNSSRIMVEGEGLVCGKNNPNVPPRPNILVQTGFPKEKTEIVEVDPDDPYAVYEVAKGMISEHQDHVVFADYTPGTKSMSAGLFLAASEFEYCTPILVKGPRLDLVKVTGDRSRVSRINRNVALASRYKDAFHILLGEQDYAGARNMINAISRLGEVEKDRDFLDRATLATLAFDLWDRFQFERAYAELETFCKQYSPANKTMIDYKVTAGQIWGIVEWLKMSEEKNDDSKLPYTVKDPKKAVPLPVYDLIRNAERRARMEQYDDAVARLYRATELFAQFSLRRLGISTSNITEETLAQLPEEQRQRLELKRDAEGRLAIGLFESYELLGGLNSAIGQVWETHKAKIKDVIRHRNMSWLAHGFEPVTRPDYERFNAVLTAFIALCEEADPDYRKSKTKLGNYPDLPNAVCFMD